MRSLLRCDDRRIGSALRYLSWAKRPWRWRIARGECPGCHGTHFLAIADGPFFTRCLRCRSNLINASVIPVVRAHFADDFAGRRAYELSSYGATFDFLRRSFADFQYSEYMPSHPLGTFVDGMRNEDVQQLTFPGESFDVVTSNQVFEHVADDRRGYTECLRVLRPGGALIFTIPLFDTPRTEEVARLAPDGRLEWLAAPEYHDSRLGGPKSAPVFHRHSIHDIAGRVRAAGFSRVTVEQVSVLRDRACAQPVIYAVK